MDKTQAQLPSKEKQKTKDPLVQSWTSEKIGNIMQPVGLQRVIDHPEHARPADVMALQRASGNHAARQLVQRQEDEEEIQTKAALEASLAGFQVNSNFEDQLKASQGNGEPLSKSLRAEMEPGFGADLSGVRVHHSSHDAELSRSISAQAFTLGQDIYMGSGKYDPGTTAGKHLLAHELTHTIQQGAAPQRTTQRIARINPQISAKIQRNTLSPDSILSALMKIPFISEKLKQTQRLRRDDALDKGPKKETMLAHIKEVLGVYSKNLKSGADAGTSQAMALAVVLEGVARIIAVNELNDPALTFPLTGKLIQLYHDEIATALGKMDDMENVIMQARALTAGDPIGDYMHDLLRLEEAARQVRKMAMLAGKDPVAFFDILRQKFEIEMATQSETKVKGREDNSSVYNVKESAGEISTTYLRKLFPQMQRNKSSMPEATIGWKKGATKGARKELAFSPKAIQMLDALKVAVGVHDAGFTGERRKWTRKDAMGNVTETQTLTTRQSAHLEEVEQKDAKEDIGSMDTIMLKYLQNAFSIDAEGAGILLDKIKVGLAELPLTLTVKASDWFSSGNPSSTVFKPGSSRKKEADFSTLFGKTGAKGKINYLGEFNDTSGQGRSKNYGRFRNWKDQKETGNRGFSDSELPTFAAVNLNWPAHSTGLDQPYGVNSYGDLHFVLKKSNILERLVYTATDHGHPHRSIYLAFLDFVLGDDLSKSLTGLKRTENQQVVRQIINSIVTKQLLATPVQCFEIQIFGELDVAKDVEKISVAPSTEQRLKDNVRNFCALHNIAFEAIAEPTEAVLGEKWFGRSPDDKGRNMTNQLQTALIFAQLPDVD